MTSPYEYLWSLPVRVRDPDLAALDRGAGRARRPDLGRRRTAARSPTGALDCDARRPGAATTATGSPPRPASSRSSGGRVSRRAGGRGVRRRPGRLVCARRHPERPDRHPAAGAGWRSARSGRHGGFWRDWWPWLVALVVYGLAPRARRRPCLDAARAARARPTSGSARCAGGGTDADGAACSTRGAVSRACKTATRTGGTSSPTPSTPRTSTSPCSLGGVLWLRDRGCLARLDPPLRDASASSRSSATSSSRWPRRWLASEDGLLGRSPGSPAAAWSATSASSGRTWSSAAWPTRSRRCRRCTPASRSSSRSTRSAGCAVAVALAAAALPGRDGARALLLRRALRGRRDRRRAGAGAGDAGLVDGRPPKY